MGPIGHPYLVLCSICVEQELDSLIHRGNRSVFKEFLAGAGSESLQMGQVQPRGDIRLIAVFCGESAELFDHYLVGLR